MLIIIFIILLIPPKMEQKKPLDEPEELPNEQWATELIQNHLINMTAEFVQDATYKLKHAEKIKDQHSHSITYELGFIAAGIQERFQRMLKSYRKYADLRDFNKQKYTVTELLNAFHVMQGDYNEIRLEKSLFHNIVWQHENRPSTKFGFSFAKEKRTKQQTSTPKSVKWRSNL